MGCAAQSVTEEEAAATSDEEISAVSQSYVVLRPDYRKCMSPICGGYYVRDANRPYGKEVYVSGLDMSLSGLDEVDAARVTGAPANELVLRGKLGAVEKKFNTRAFRVTEAYRGMPGVTVQSGDLFYRAHFRDPQITCITAPCNNTVGQKLNFKPEFDFTTLTVDDAAKPFVDKAWLSRRVLSHDAIVAAKLRNGAKFPGGYEKVLDASQVFVRIPDLAGPCPMFPIHMCPEGKVNTFSHNADRCSIPTGCATPGICPMYMPACEPGYTLASWTSQPAACQAYACEPAFLYNE
jgi:hypothetical protein